MPAYKDENNNTWYAKFRYKDWNGKVKDKTKRGFKTKREAISWEENFKVRISGSLEMSMKEFYEVYKADRFPRLKEVTRAAKEYMIESKILPYFGNKPLNQISSTDVLKWQNTLLTHVDKDGHPYSKTYLKTLHNQLSAMFNHAVRFYHLPTNPACQAGNIGNESDIQMKFWTLDEYQRFSEAAMDEPQYYYYFQILYWMGIREGEALALLQSDFDFEEKTLSITKTYQVVHGSHLITKPKTPKSVRKVSMPDFLCEEFKDFFSSIPEELKEERIFYGLSKSMIARHLRKNANIAGVKVIRVHDLRHSHVSLLINMGYSAVAIANRVGHESIHITYKYAHLFPDTQKEMVDRLNNLAVKNSEEGGVDDV